MFNRGKKIWHRFNFTANSNSPVFGLTGADAFKNTLSWNLPPVIKGAVGVANYSFGNVVTDAVYKDGTVTVRSNAPYTLTVNGRSYPVKPGENIFEE
ncbi:MAG: hypothetical protein IKA87_02150 [Lentisphaeria bacterium]|nr:hypothetical protein [Lentisphaeria bacterium]